MLKESIARRYSAALFALAEEAGAIEKTVAELDTFVAALRKDADVAAFYASPVLDRVEKTKMLSAALEPRMSELSLNFLILLVRKRRENLVELVAQQMHELLDEQAGREPAEIATPVPLSAHELAQLAKRLSTVYGKNIIPRPRVEPGLLGGLVVQVGDRYVDASVSGKLEELRRHLLASADVWRPPSPNGQARPQEAGTT